MPSQWPALAREISICRACAELAATRQKVVVGDPAPTVPARLVFVGEAPGAQEDAAGKPFVGKAGQLLDQLLADAGMSRAEVGVLNVIKCRPPNNRRPTPAEVAQCRPYLERQLALLQPRLIVALGLALVLNMRARGIGFYRTVFYLLEPRERSEGEISFFGADGKSLAVPLR